MSRAQASVLVKSAFPGRLALGAAALDQALQGGLEKACLHEITPAGIFHLGAAAGFALGLAARHTRPGDILWVQQDFAHLEGGALYGPGCEIFGIDPRRLLIVRARHAKDLLWTMEEGLRCCGISTVIAECGEQGEAADLTATRRLSLAAQSTGALGLLLRQHAHKNPSACATRWQVASAPGRSDGFGGLGRLGFRLTLTKNRRGACSDWIVEWDHHAKCFTSPSSVTSAHSVAVAAPAFDRPADAAQNRHVA
jgi:protein ImuA